MTIEGYNREFYTKVFAMKNRLTQRNYRRKRRSCPLCKPNKTHGDDARDIRTMRESFGHAQQLREV